MLRGFDLDYFDFIKLPHKLLTNILIDVSFLVHIHGYSPTKITTHIVSHAAHIITWSISFTNLYFIITWSSIKTTQCHVFPNQ